MQSDLRKSRLGLLFVLALLLTLGTLFQDFRFDQSLTRDRLALSSLEREIGSLDVALSDLRAAQTGYLATGQGPDFWMRRASELFGRLEMSLTNLRDTSTSADARARYETA